jgi:hypothetical protein
MYFNKIKGVINYKYHFVANDIYCWFLDILREITMDREFSLLP